MTLALAASCTDGVVVVEDKALTRMDTFEVLRYDEKLRGVIRNVIFGYAGVESIYDIFVKCVVGELVILRDDEAQKYTSINMLSKFCSILETLRNLIGSFRLEILVARQVQRDGKSDLNLLLETAGAVPVETWKTIGDGATVADPLVRDFWKKKDPIKMRDFAKTSHCIIKFIEKEELAVGVGVGLNNPSIRYLEHGADKDVQPSAAEFDSFDSCYESYSKGFKSVLGSEYFELKDSTKRVKRFKTVS